MNVENLDKLKEDTDLFEKVLLAHWYSIPSDSDRTPDQIKVVREQEKFFGTNLIKNDVVYGYMAITKLEIERYIEKLKTLQLHEDDIIQRFDREEKQ